VKRAFLAFALMLAVPLTPVSAQHVVNFREADIRAFIEDAARVTGRTFIVDPAVNGKVSVVTQRPLSRSEYFELFLSTLRANGLLAVPISGGAFRIQPVAGAASTSSARVSRRGSPNNFVTEIFRLRNIEGAQALESLRPLISREGSITSTPIRSSWRTMPTMSPASARSSPASTATRRRRGSSPCRMPVRGKSRPRSAS
jgi:general secretion pathway protein D